MLIIFMTIAGIFEFYSAGFEGLLLGLCFLFGWKFITYLENQVFYLTTLENLFYWKFMFKPVLAGIIAPVCAPTI